MSITASTTAPAPSRIFCHSRIGFFSTASPTVSTIASSSESSKPPAPFKSREPPLFPEWLSSGRSDFPAPAAPSSPFISLSVTGFFLERLRRFMPTDFSVTFSSVSASFSASGSSVPAVSAVCSAISAALTFSSVPAVFSSGDVPAPVSFFSGSGLNFISKMYPSIRACIHFSLQATGLFLIVTAARWPPVISFLPYHISPCHTRLFWRLHRNWKCYRLMVLKPC